MPKEFRYHFDNDGRMGKCPICGKSNFDLKTQITENNMKWHFSCSNCCYHLEGYNMPYVIGQLRFDQLKIKFCEENK